MIPFSSSDSIRLHSDVKSAVLSLLSFPVVLQNTTHDPSTVGGYHESPSSVFPVFCFLFWVAQERFVDILDGTAGLGGLVEQDLMLCREMEHEVKGAWMVGEG